MNQLSENKAIVTNFAILLIASDVTASFGNIGNIRG
jgi:hypothetical protein